MIPTRQAHDVLGGHLEVLGQFGALPRRVVWDQEGAIGQWRGGKQVFTAEFQSFRGTLGIGAQLCQRGDPEAKGLDRAGQPLLRDELPAGPPLRVRRRLQRPVHRLAAPGEPAHPRHHQGPSSRGDLRRPRVDAGRSRRCCPTRRCGSASGCHGITTCGSTPATTRSTRASSAAASTCASPSTEVVATCAGVEVARHRRCLAAHQTLTVARARPDRPHDARRGGRRRTSSPPPSSSNATSPSTTGRSELR